MNEQNITALKSQLLALHFENGLEYELRRIICYQPARFVIKKQIAKEKDTLCFQLYFERVEDSGQYSCKYYEVVLRKEIVIPDISIGEVSTKELDHRMAAINWNVGCPAPERSNVPGDWKREEAIEAIVLDLKRIAESEEGKGIAERLKVKYWRGTAAEVYMARFNALQNSFETSQRFYCWEVQDNITIEEAYRFLNNKWREKQLAMHQKENEKDSPGGIIITDKSRGKTSLSKKHGNRERKAEP